MADELVEVSVKIATHKGMQEAKGYALAEGSVWAVTDTSQWEPRDYNHCWNVTHREVGLRAPDTDCQTKEEAIEYLKALAAIPGFERVEIKRHILGEMPELRGLTSDLKRRARGAIKSVENSKPAA